jgi:hypothetical protein
MGEDELSKAALDSTATMGAPAFSALFPLPGPAASSPETSCSCRLQPRLAGV